MIDTPRTIWLIGSGGVKNAAAMKMPTMAMRRLRVRKSGVSKPALAKSVRKTGNWKAKPKARMRVVIKDR